MELYIGILYQYIPLESNLAILMNSHNDVFLLFDLQLHPVTH